MTAHPHASRRAANPGIDQLATQIRNDRKGRHPELVALEGLEQQLLPLFVQVGGEQVDPEQAGITMLIIGQLLNDLVSKLPPEEQRRAPAIIVNLLRMIGQRLYAGDLPEEPTLRCPFRLAHGAECQFEPKVSMGGTLTTVMQGHVALHHPGEVWPPVDETVPAETVVEAEAFCACGNPADIVVTEGDTARAQCAECVRVDLLAEVAQEGVVRIAPEACTHPKHNRIRLPGGERCSACGAQEGAPVITTTEPNAALYGLCDDGGHPRSTRTTTAIEKGGKTVVHLDIVCPMCETGEPDGDGA
jgi:hypothetical protein